MADQASTLLDAGALVPIKTKIKDQSHVDEISARRYRHSALGDRPVVRLSADKLAQGDDLEMEFLGFEPPEVHGPLAYRRRQALGFPGWALIHDPDHARYALELVKEFKKAVRKSKSKPGHGYDAFVEIAGRLGKSVAHFLPSFWEQVGREFIQIGNSTYASRAFGKAREAEKVHALKVDEKLRQDAFLEFALAGCLSNKALTEYGKELQSSLPGPEAWQFFRELCVRRTLGGMPPWTSLVKDLKPLIADAKLDVDREIKSLLAEILESPAMSRAAIGFWKSCSSHLIELAQENDRAAGILLNLLPETSRWDRSDVWKWLEILDAWQILPNAWKDGVSKEAGPEGGTAAWFSRYSTIQDQPPQKLYEILKSAAARINKDKKPVDLTVKNWGNASINIDLLDLALELKIPLTESPDDTELSLTDWASPNDDAQDRPRDPVFVHGHKKFGKLLENAVPNAAGQTEFEAQAKGKKALSAARKNWLMGLIGEVADGGLPGAEVALNHLEGKTTKETFREFPEAYEKLKTIDLAPVLGRTLAGGVIDEFGWPIAEEVADRLSKNGKQEITVYGRFPYLMISDGLNVVVVDHEKIVLEHELQIPKKSKVEDILFYDGQLCVFFESKKYQSMFYWSSDPKKTQEQYHYGREQIGGASIDMPEGGSYNGHKIVHAGDKDGPASPNPFVFDGEHFWKLSWRDEGQAFREIDPKTGKEGRWSMPSFFEDYLAEGSELVESNCELLHLGDAVKSSPLGSREGTVGWRTRKTKAGHFESEGIDGRSWNKKDSLGGRSATCLVDQPGSSERLPITGEYGWSWGWYDHPTLWDPAGAYEVARWEANIGPYNSGQLASMPPLFWHAFQVRDEKISKKLRSTNQAQAKKLLAAVLKDIEQSDELEDPLSDLSATEAELNNWLKGLDHPRLLRGLLGVVHHAGIQAARLASLIESADPESKESLSFDPALEACVETAMAVFNIHTGWGDSDPLFPHLGEVLAFISGEKTSPNIAPAPFDWWELLENIDVRIWCAYFEAGEKEPAWLTFLEQWADTGIADLPGRFRILNGEFDGSPPINLKSSAKARGPVRAWADDGDKAWVGYHHQGNVYFLSQQWDEDFRILEYAPTGKFHLLPKFTIEDETVYEPGWKSDRIREFAALARANEKPMLDNEQFEAISNRLGVTAAEVGLAWFGFPNFNSWEKNFLPKHLREHLKLKVAEAEAARQSLKALPPETQHKLIKGILAGPLEDIWKAGSQRPLESLAKAWGKVVPKRLSLPPKILDQLTGAFSYHLDKGQILVALASPKSHPLFTAEESWTYGKNKDAYWTELTCKKKGETFDGEVLTAAAISIPFLNYHLPVGDPARNELPAVQEAALKCLKSENLLVQVGRQSSYDAKNEEAGKDLLEKILGKKSKKHNDGWLVDDGMFLGYAEGYTTDVAVRPAKVKTEKQYERIEQIANLCRDEEWHIDNSALEALRLIRSDGYQAISKRIEKTPVPEGAYETNPSHSAAKLVKDAEKKHGLSPEAAVLYLQTLALPDCTSANVKLWNDWTTAVYNKAAKELVKKKLVLEAKRARAGRKHFLPGGWEALKLPHLPIETWKLPLFEIARDSEGRVKPPLPRILPLIPMHELFEAAWNRVQKGDAPAYEDVT